MSTTTDQPDVNLGGTSVASGTDASQGSAYTLQVYCQTVLQTPTLVPPAIPGVPADPTLNTSLTNDLATAQLHATYYLETLNPQLIGLSSQIIGYGNQWTAMFNQLLTDANNINDPTSRTDFISGINLLINKAHTGKTFCGKAATALVNFSTSDLAVDIQNFTNDYNSINAIYGSASSEQAQLQQAIDACNTGMRNDLIVMGASALGLLAGGVAVTIGVLAEIPSAGTSSALIVGGFFLAAGSAVAGSVAAVDWVNQNKTLQKATYALSQAEAICASTQQAMENVQSLSTACTNASNAALALSDTWDSLASDLGETAQALAKAEYNIDSSWLVSLLNSANADWQQALSIAQQLQSGSASLSVKTTTTDNS